MKSSNENGAEAPSLSEVSGESTKQKDSGLLGEISFSFLESDPVTACFDTRLGHILAPTVGLHPMKDFNWDVTQRLPIPITGIVTPPLTRFPLQP